MQPHVMEVEKSGLPALDAQRKESEDEDMDETDRYKDKKTKGRGDKARASTLTGRPRGSRRGVKY